MSNDNEEVEVMDDVPPTEPQSAPMNSSQTATVDPPKRKRGRPRKVDIEAAAASASAMAAASAKPMGVVGRLDGASLVPTEDHLRDAKAESYWYWVGVTPRCPVEHIDLAGVNFPKVNELVTAGPDGRTNRAGVIGSLLKLSREKIALMAERLPRTMIRFTEPATDANSTSGAGMNFGDRYNVPRKGKLITIPTREWLDERNRNGAVAQPYTPQPDDEPAARYMFCVLCSNQERGNRGDSYPETMETAGIEWPAE